MDSARQVLVSRLKQMARGPLFDGPNVSFPANSDLKGHPSGSQQYPRTLLWYLLADTALRLCSCVWKGGYERYRVVANKRDQPMVYQIRVKGHLGPGWTDWFEGLTITLEEGDTLLTGPVVDQAALHGLLRRVRDLGVPLLSVIQPEKGE